jgi:hypothetical protein
MKKVRNITLPARGYVLPEERHTALQDLCDHWSMLAQFITVITNEEADTPLRVHRLALTAFFDKMAEELHEVLESTRPCRELRRDTPKPH